jgi:hypothetical protein
MTMRALFLLPLLSALAAPLTAQVVRGKVLDAATGDPVPQAEVTASTTEGRGAGRTRAGADGSFSLELRAAGTFRLRAERAGYRPTVTDTLQVDARVTLEVEIRLSATAVAIEPLRVTARVEPPHRRNLELNGFYERERRGIGRFVRREEIERHGDFTLAQTLSRIPGTQIQYVRVHQYIFFPRSGCRPWVFLDGSRMVVDASNDINSIVSPNQVEAIEVFVGPSEVPAEYAAGRGACGVVLIWTKHEA